MGLNVKAKNRILIAAALLAFLIVLAVAGRYISVFSTHVLADQEKWGQFGDYFGGVLNPIFSFLAFIALLVTLRAQFTANEDSERRHDEQLREQRLFQLISLMNENALSAKVLTVRYIGHLSRPHEYAHGHQALHHSAIILRDELARRVRIFTETQDTDMGVFQSLEGKFRNWRKGYWPSVGLYIESVFLVLEFILKEKSSESFKQFSLGALRVQFSESERLLIWYTAMFTAEYSVYLIPLSALGFVDDYDGSLDDQLKPWRSKLVQCSLVWSSDEIQNRAVQPIASMFQ